MTDRTTINVSKEAHRKAKEAKEDGESWSDYITRCIDNQESPNPSIDGEELAQELSEALADELGKKLGSDLEQAAYRGSKDAVESVVR